MLAGTPAIMRNKGGTPMTGYALDNSWDRAKRRLELLEHYLDPFTRRRFAALGIRDGLSCLEIGAGGGSIALWLSEKVGLSGKVVATDINTALFDNLRRPNLVTLQHDILNDPLPETGFDIVHTRWLLHHLPDPEKALRRMVEALCPGGWLLVEEVDFFPVHASPSADYSDFMTALVNTVVKASGRDCFWARALPKTIAGMGLSNVGAEGDYSILQGGSPVAEFFKLTAEQMKERMFDAGTIDPSTFARSMRLLSDPTFWSFGGGGVAVWGQRPVGE
ncbi:MULTISPECIES: class I SAM-dependent methyltransferase [unclassified Rhizobium]|uniref:class I SAM-dependent methyltransferase n=1 Tax=unclassified Rhizobium TaxID=2613769 RepID=UPI0009F42A51|nr:MULTISPECIES: class I SAM-dependent methyltransferase [unclassified Rhizobium]